MNAQHTPEEQWYVMEWPRRYWFGQDEDAARTYLLRTMCAFGMKAGIDVFLGRDVPPPHIAKLAGITE